MKKTIVLLLALTICAQLSISYAELDVYYLDVGQGDAAVILFDGEAMVIDGGPVKASSYMYSFIKNTLGLHSVKYMIASHPHEDHIGGLSGVLNAVPVDLIL